MDERGRDDFRRPGLPGPRNDGTEDHITTACEGLLQHVAVDAVAVSVSCRGRKTVLASDWWAEQLEEHQYVVGEGPTPDVIETGLGVLVPDLRTKRGQWPVFTDAAATLALAAAFTFPLLHAETSPIGALTLYRRTSGPLSTAELRYAVVTAHFLAKVVALTDLDALPDHHLLVTMASDLLASRHAISQDDALVIMRAHAFAQDCPLHDIAEAVVVCGMWATSLDEGW